MTIAVDFDGTIVEHRYPEIGQEIPFATDTLKMLIADHHKLILWSVREGELLDEPYNGARTAEWNFMLLIKIILKNKARQTTTTTHASLKLTCLLTTAI